MIEQLRVIVGRRTQVDVADLTEDTNLWAAGMTSMESVRVLIDAEATFGVELAAEALTRNSFASLAALRDTIVAARDAASMGTGP